MYRPFIRTTIIAMGCTVSIASSAFAVTMNTVSFRSAELGRGTCGSTPAASFSSPDNVQRTFNTGNDFKCIASLTARAGDGGVGLLGSMRAIRGSGTGAATVFAETVIDIMLTTPQSYTGGVIPVSLVAHLSGIVEGVVEESTSPFSRGGTASLTAKASISGQPFNARSGPTFRSSASVNAFASAGNDNFGARNVVLDQLPNFLSLATIFINPLEPVQVKFSLSASLRHSTFNDTITSARVLAFNSLSFALIGPALILPDGFSANSVSGMIVDNVFVGARVSAVPLPASGPLFIAALAGLGLLSRRRKSRES